MKKVLLAASLAILPLSMAQAADASFAGPYIGAAVGLGSFNSQFQDIDDEFDNQGVNGDTETAFSPAIYAGWNFQNDNFVYGVELSYNSYSLTSESTPYGTSSVALLSTELKSVISLKAKAGVAVGSSLIYVAVGESQASVDGTINQDDGNGAQSASDDVTGLSYAVGIEHQFTPNLLGRAQFDTAKFETSDDKETITGSHFNATSDATNVSVGVAYKF